MREIKYEGESALITEKEWSYLLERFDMRKVVEEDGGACVVNCSCVLCEEHIGVGDCGECPLDVFRDDDGEGCTRLMHVVIELAGLGSSWAFAIGGDDITWSKGDDMVARQQLTAVYNALENLPKVKENPE